MRGLPPAVPRREGVRLQLYAQAVRGGIQASGASSRVRGLAEHAARTRIAPLDPAAPPPRPVAAPRGGEGAQTPRGISLRRPRAAGPVRLVHAPPGSRALATALTRRLAPRPPLQYGCCKICSVEFRTENLSKRQAEADDTELEARARKRRCQREQVERAANLEWARRVAPSVAHILYRHFRHAGHEPQGAELGFGTIVLSLIHSGEQYLEDLSERLSETLPRAEVEAAVKRLQSLGDALVSAHQIDLVDDACQAEFMRHFTQALAERSSAPFRRDLD